MNNQLRRLTTKRVADFFVSVNAGNELTPTKESQQLHPADIFSWTFNANVVDRYPLIDRLTQPLPEGIPIFCFPNGVQLFKRGKDPTFHTFVHTSEGGCRMLGCCLTFYRKLNDDQINSLNKIISESNIQVGTNLATLFIPYSVCLISHWTFVSSFKKFIWNLYQMAQSESCPIPIERYICNFIDDVPAPPAGRIDVTYFIGDGKDSGISFRCPPSNQPNVWSGMPLFPLFECLSPEKILNLFALVLVERQVLFVSSQYSLLTLSAEAITSLLYPITWSHAYIPILPKMILGFVAAPFPFIAGVHTSYFDAIDKQVCEETAKIYLDTNEIDYGVMGPPPPLPEKRAKKLLQEIISAGRVFELRGGEAWKDDRLRCYDDARSSVSERPGTTMMKSSQIDDVLRSAFLKFFVNILKNYRKHLVYGNSMEKFQFQNFLQGLTTLVLLPVNYVTFFHSQMLHTLSNIHGTLSDCTSSEHPVEWRPFLEEMVHTQQFSEFIDSRLFEVGRDPDVVFFDESIDAKLNRYTFAFGKIDTPFLNSADAKHTKTYVAPSPDTTGVPPNFKYPEGLASLHPSFYSAPRNLQPPPLSSGLSSSVLHLARLKRASTTFLPPTAVVMSATSCTFGSYLVTLSRLICYTQSHLFEFSRAPRTSVQQIIEEYGIGGDDTDGSTHYSEKSNDIGRIDIRAIEQTLVDRLEVVAEKENESHRSDEDSRELRQCCDINDTNLDQRHDEHSISPLRVSAHSGNDDVTNGDFPITHLTVPHHDTFDHRVDVSGLSVVSRISTGREDSAGNSRLQSSRTRSRTNTRTTRMRSESCTAQDKDLEDAAKLAMKVALEALNCLSKLDEPADDSVYRSLAEACGCVGFAQEIIDLIVHMGDEGLVADNQMLSSVARAIAHSGSSPHSTEISNSRVQSYLRNGDVLNNQPVAGSTVSITPAQVWNLQDSEWAQYSKNSICRRKINCDSDRSSVSSVRTSLPTLMKDTKSIDSVVDWFLGPGISSNTSTIAAISTAGDKSSGKGTSSNSSSATPTENCKHDVIRSKKRASSGKLSFRFPNLNWKWSPDQKIDPSTVFAASRRLHRQMMVAEELMVGLFHDLRINLENPQGMTCPGQPGGCCPLMGKPLTLDEIYEGWDIGNANKYTTTCFACGRDFVPRFTVECTSKNWVGSEGPRTPLWCELLSPWTLRKELFTVLFEEGVEQLISPSFRHPSLSAQAVLFWNTLVAFRLHGLPYSFLLCGQSITNAFPQPPQKTSIEPASPPAYGATSRTANVP